ncbi:Chaperone protein HtpG [Sulfurovum sp. enrichment culture clone C5]|uniref:Chaperone protein HtpG n=1 Tax=Sulfurovum sp. enrichment culture clone C5 TaxID=497650 RepID=A0A0S4XQ24_9BACT|nr:Chaperone protein HtpG [Sulfurovum sp. enrichment culture clone C5]
MAKHTYQTEIGQLLHLMTHSLYSNKEIFIRELISNASDALDKFNYFYLTDEKYKNDDWKPSIFITLDKDDNSITIGDNGIGMSEEDLMNNLGTIAKSGTKSFVENLTGDAKKDSNLIGQFGVGFYSVFMVAKQVDVITKKDDQAYKFSSDGTGEFDISLVTKESRGTIIYIKLKDEEKEFTSPWRIKEIVKKYSNHIAYPIMLNFKEEETVGEGDDKKTELVSKSEQINAAKALWTISKSELKKEDYIEFYKSISHGDEEPLTYLHNKAEGANEYTTLFYIPKNAPMDMFRAEWESGVKLYVKRVFITDSDKELLPSYLRFVKGIIDSSDLPLNVSRELLQENKILANIKQGSTKKILQAIAKLDGETKDTFTKEYNRLIKEGIYTDYTNKELLLDIVRYKSSSEAGYVSFADYISRGNSEKKEIYYIIAKNEAIAKSSPLLESYKSAGLEVLIMDDYEVDEIVTPAITKYKEWSLKDISTIDAPSSKTKEEQDALDESVKPLLEKIKEVLGDAVKDVKASSRLVDSPSCVLKDSSDPMASMAHIFRQMGQEVPDAALILEINPDHNMVKKLDSLSDKEMFEDISWILLDNAKISEGIDIDDKADFAKRVARIATKAL